jgi:hypothetical protein
MVRREDAPPEALSRLLSPQATAVIQSLHQQSNSFRALQRGSLRIQSCVLVVMSQFHVSLFPVRRRLNSHTNWRLLLHTFREHTHRCHPCRITASGHRRTSTTILSFLEGQLVYRFGSECSTIFTSRPSFSWGTSANFLLVEAQGSRFLCSRLPCGGGCKLDSRILQE